MSERRPRPSFRAVRANWSASREPFFARLREALANNWRKLRMRRNCCGSYGAPGC